ncbi:DUF4129 domain-containing protein [Streptomyces sp. NPDC005963]|uniref:DUF4129 domain-containing protein n=1 Tax=Streptomyces sp. NPDC005963 TaxID=3156721 RepID=UPI0033F158A1
MLVPRGVTTARHHVRAGDDMPVDTPRTPAREAAERELSKPEYHENDPNLLQRAIDRFWEWIGDVLTFSATTPGGIVGVTVIVLVVLALLFALWKRLGPPHRALRSTVPLFADSPRSAAEHRAAADAHAALNEWAPAVQERMRAIVRSLEERALLDPRPGRTANEAAAEASLSLPAHSQGLHFAATAFDEVTYGGRTGSHDTHLRLLELDTALESARPRLTSPTHHEVG